MFFLFFEWKVYEISSSSFDVFFLLLYFVFVHSHPLDPTPSSPTTAPRYALQHNNSPPIDYVKKTSYFVPHLSPPCLYPAPLRFQKPFIYRSPTHPFLSRFAVLCGGFPKEVALNVAIALMCYAHAGIVNVCAGGVLRACRSVPSGCGWGGHSNGKPERDAEWQQV